MGRRILVNQITRMGDVLQTSPLIRAVREQHPDAFIVMLVRRMGKPVAERNPDVDEVLIYDEDALYVNLRARDSLKLLEAYRTAEAFLEKLRGYGFDEAYNCTHSLSSALLMRIVGIPVVHGAHVSEHWSFILRGGWTNYLFASLHNREYSDINLCDVFRQLIANTAASPRLVFEVCEEDRRAAADLLQNHGLDGERPIVCFQLGASENEKRWPEYRFAELAGFMADQMDAQIVLVGVNEEAGFGDAFEQAGGAPAARLYGETSLPVLGALLERSHLLVSNDTGTMHIAAAVECPTVLVSVGHVHFRETGPYGKGHVAVERRTDSAALRPEKVLDDERAFIQADQVLKAVQLALQGDQRQLADTAELDSVVLYRSDFAPDGCLEWYPVIRRAATQIDLLRIAYRAMWLDALTSEPKATAERMSLTRMAGHFESSGAADEWSERLAPVFAELAAMAERGSRMAEELIDILTMGRPMSQANELAHRMSRLDGDMRVYGAVNDAARPLTAIARFEQDNLEGSNPLLLAQTTLQIYRDLQVRSELMMDKLGAIGKMLSGA